ncbi:MAG: DUF5667 domain-containing protein [Anaerolineales bacterium]|nr:DUF5667 domain-containing protein [Anaerolineales bacterium]
MTTLVTILTIVGLLAGGGAGTVYAAQDSLPNEALYGVKIASENVQLQMAGNAQEELALHLEFAQHRTDEIAALLGEGVIPSEEVMLRLQAEMQAAFQLANGMEESAMLQAMQQTQTMLQAQMQTMTQLQQNASPNASAMLEQTRSMLQNQFMLAQSVMEGNNHPESQAPGEGFGPGMEDGMPSAEFTPGTGDGSGMGDGTPGAGFDSGMGNGTPGAGMGGGTPATGMDSGMGGGQGQQGGGMSGPGN